MIIIRKAEELELNQFISKQIVLIDTKNPRSMNRDTRDWYHLPSSIRSYFYCRLKGNQQVEGFVLTLRVL